MKSIRKWLEEDAGITLAITSLTSYISASDAVWQPNEARSFTGQLVQPETHSDLTRVRPLRLRQLRALRPKTIRSLKPSALCRNRSSTSASSITTVIPKAEI